MWCIYNRHTYTNGIRSLSVKNIKVRKTMIRALEKYIIYTIITLILLALKSDLVSRVLQPYVILYLKIAAVEISNCK